MKAPELLLLDKPSSELLLPVVSCVFLLPLLSIFYHLAISFLPSVSSFLPFYFFLACTHLAYLSALFLFLLALLLSSTCYSFVHLSSRCVHFPRFLVPISSLKFFFAFPLSRSISLPVPLLPPHLLPFSPTSPLLVSLILILTPPFSLI